MRATWDALASDPDAYVGDPERGRAELESLFGRLGADPRGGDVHRGRLRAGTDDGRRWRSASTASLALDVSPAMLDQARAAVPDDHVEFRAVSGERLDGVETETANAVVCYLVLQHLPVARDRSSRTSPSSRACSARRRGVPAAAGARGRTARPRLARDALRARAADRVSSARRGGRSSAATACARGELDAGCRRAGLRVVATDFGPDAPYRYSPICSSGSRGDRARARRLRRRARRRGDTRSGAGPSSRSTLFLVGLALHNVGDGRAVRRGRPRARPHRDPGLEGRAAARRARPRRPRRGAHAAAAIRAAAARRLRARVRRCSSSSTR